MRGRERGDGKFLEKKKNVLSNLSAKIMLNVHGDVLNACPLDEDGKMLLVTEIKNRCRNSVKMRNFPEAIQLYSKALELMPNDAILLSNRSMCYASMNNASDAIKDAVRSSELDPTYAKSYYRFNYFIFTTLLY